MERIAGFFRFSWFIALSGLGGALFSLTGMPVGWLIGTIVTATLISLSCPKVIPFLPKQKGLPKYWMFIGQCILGIELGLKLNSSIIGIFQQYWMTIFVMMLLSVAFSLLLGLILWKYSNLDILTSFFATAPGGLSTIPGIAEEVGANTGVVSILQTVRAFLVILIVPTLMSMPVYSVSENVVQVLPVEIVGLKFSTFLMTCGLIVVALIGWYIGKKLKVPAPWLIGTMVAVGAVKIVGSISFGYDVEAWWPATLIIVAQIFMGASIGSRFHKEMFVGITRILVVSFICTIGLIAFVFAGAYIVSIITNISLVTSSLAFAPGGIAEMTTTALLLNGDATFVVAVQVLRIIVVCLTLPPFFKLLQYLEGKKRASVTL